MNKKIMIPFIGLAATGLIAAFGSTALAIEKQKGQCTLTNGGIVKIKGPCDKWDKWVRVK